MNRKGVGSILNGTHENTRTTLYSGKLSYKTGLSGKLYPNGEFTLGYDSSHKEKESDRQYEKDLSQNYEEITLRNYHEHGYEGLTNRRQHQQLVDQGAWWHETEVPSTNPRTGVVTTECVRHYTIPKSDPLSSSTVRNSHKGAKRGKYGCKGITSYGRRMIRNGCEMMEKRFGVKRLGLWTFTIPYTDTIALMVICAEWGNLVRKLMQELRREVERKSGEFEYVAATEIQEKRYQRTGQFAPHLHIVAPCRKDSRKLEWYVTADKMRSIWERLLRNLLKSAGIEEDGVGFEASVNCQIIKKSASQYISKYMSKGGDITVQAEEEGAIFPSQWWSMANTLRDKIKALIREVPSDLKQAIKDLGEKLVERGILTYLFPVIITSSEDGKERDVGWVGRLPSRGKEIFMN